MADFSGKSVIVTGAGKGIGRDISEALASRGAKIYAVARTESDLQSLKSKYPENVSYSVLDVGDWQAVDKWFSSLDSVDVLINNAGVNILEHCSEVTKESAELLMKINLLAPIHLTQLFGKKLISESKPGCILNISSQASQRAFSEHIVYCSTKAGLDQATRSAAFELGPHKIRVNALNPTVVLTDLGKAAWSDPVKSAGMLKRIPLGKFLEVEDVTSAALFLISDDAKMITGQCLAVDGGLQCT